MTWMDAMEQYGSDKPDLRFGMKIVDLTAVAKGKILPCSTMLNISGPSAHLNVPDIPVNN